MDRYTIEALKAMLCRELDDVVRHGIRSHQDLDLVKDAADALKNLEELGMSSMDEYADMGLDMRKYSQRGNNYRMRNSYNYYDEDSYARSMQGGQGGNSNRMYPSMMARGYSRTGNKEDILQELHEIVENTSDDKVKSAVLECVSKMEKMM